MTQMEQQIADLARKATSTLAACEDATVLEAWRVAYIGRSGIISTLLRTVKDLSAEEKKIIGSKANFLRRLLEEQYQEKLHILEKDKGLPAIAHAEGGATAGHVHPLTLTLQRVSEIFAALGFIIADGPEVEEAKYNFDLLNIPAEHPARSEDDTFFVNPASVGGAEHLVLRTQTSPMQIRSVAAMDLHPPFSVIAPGRVFRREKVDATHESTFYQFEGLSISETTSIADFKSVIETFFSTFFNAGVTIRLRPSYFPFVEPGFEVDMSCPFCKSGCRVCKYTGWIEVMGAGMVHPNVLKNMNIDPEKYQGYAFGGAIDRLTMIQYGINDIRLFWSGDIRFLRQFS
ncbi:MAG TPA: phenylalanine--tRNA ligase subunit alpha [Candidatus Andersenbacteria bacterium]|nr:phenylalanine--tRNA ligase subunit alpha [Candidatus Andersenbacteria bacterium]